MKTAFERGGLAQTLWRSADAQTALESFGLVARCYRLVTTLPSLYQPRCAFRVDLRDGRTVKLRGLAREEDAQRLCRVGESLPDGFVPVLARHKAILLEPWVTGRRLVGASPRTLAQAAFMLRSLHALHPVRRTEAAPYLEEIEMGLSELRLAGKLSPLATEELREMARKGSPVGPVSETLLHHDFCAENLIVAPDDLLWSVDNETLCWGPVALELARVRHRWPMSDRAWRHFLALYEAEAPSPFWHLLARLRGARMRVRYGVPRADEAVDRVRELLQGQPV